MKRFDRKFGVNFLAELPQSPAVYLFKDEAGDVIYVGKAKNVRRRLSDYRNATRRKAHRKMREVVRDAEAVEIRLQDSEAEAVLLENELIRELRPVYNVDGAFEFLYPAIGTGIHEERMILCLTSAPDHYSALDLQWHGTFRPRLRARQAFDALSDVCAWIGHPEPTSRLPKIERSPGSRVVAFRRVPAILLPSLRQFLDGESKGFLADVSTELLESVEARRKAAEVQSALRALDRFFKRDIRRLREARIANGVGDPFVPRDERDQLFIRTRYSA